MSPRRIPLPHLFAGTICIGLASSTLARGGAPALAGGAAAMLLAAGCTGTASRVALLVVALALGGWWWGSVRLATLDRSVLLPRVDTAERTLVEITAPPRLGSFQVRARARVLRFGTLEPHENVLLELPRGPLPPQGALLSVIAVVRLPRGPVHGFDERTWLRRNGVHVVLRAHDWHIVGRRGGLGGVADRLHGWLERDSARGLGGEPRAIVDAIVLGETQGLSDPTLARFRASGLYHVLAVDGLKVAAVAGGAVALAFLLGAGRYAAELFALAAVSGYVLAVGERPSVLRAAIGAALVSLAWLTGRQRDRWHALLVAAVALLAWNPYFVADAGFQLSFAAVASIFVIAPRVSRRLEGYPVPRSLAQLIGVSTACGVATAPITWLQFHQISLVTVPANVVGVPVVAEMLGLALLTALTALFSPTLAGGLAHVNGWGATLLVGWARITGGLPYAQITSARAAASVAAFCVLVAAGVANRH